MTAPPPLCPCDGLRAVQGLSSCHAATVARVRASARPAALCDRLTQPMSTPAACPWPGHLSTVARLLSCPSLCPDHARRVEAGPAPRAPPRRRSSPGHLSKLGKLSAWAPRPPRATGRSCPRRSCPAVRGLCPVRCHWKVDTMCRVQCQSRHNILWYR